MGHALSIAVVVAAVVALGLVLDRHLLDPLAGAVLLGWALYDALYGHRHRVRVGMQTGMVGLGLWSFTMATGHGAGLMLAPVLLGLPVYGAFHSLRELSLQAVAAASLHVAAMLLVMGIVSVVVYEKVGLGILRRGWFNLDLGWSFVLIVSGFSTLFTAL